MIEKENPELRAEKIAFYTVFAFFIMFLIWCWCYGESKNEIKNLKKEHELYVDSLNNIIGELQANLQIQLDTIHNNASKIPE
jgi:p-aminobenzoyl-glutamate transporter AbgT